MVRVKKLPNESITFRLNKESLDKLTEAAGRQQMSLNMLVNQILTEYINWGASAVGAGWLVLTREELKLMFAKLEKTEIMEIAEKAAKSSKDMRLLMTSKNDIEAFLTMLRNRVKHSGFQVKENQNGNNLTIILQHDMGENMSLYLRTIYEIIIHDLGYAVKTDHTANTVILDIENLII